MNRRNKKTYNKKQIKSKNVIRCKTKMSPVFESDSCDNFIKKDNAQSEKNCKNCKNSF